jgi:hypothetical protein
MASTKTLCPISRADCVAHAKPVEVSIDGNKHIAIPKEFSTDSLGWNINGKMTVMVNGVPCVAQVGMNITLVGSKELPKTAPAAKAS